jgi:hypothetical protein
MFKKISVILLATAVGGCQTHTWAPGPNAQGTYEEAQGRCSIMARHSGGSYYARGNATFVASAMAGAAIGEMIRANSDFNDCMQANGWVAVEQQQKADPQVAALRQRAIDTANQLKACIEGVKAKTEYAPIRAHLLDANVGHYTLVQMSSQQFPTPAEGQLLASYGDESAVCRERATQEVAQLDPRAGHTLQQAATIVRELDLRLINRSITYGDYAKGAQTIMDATMSGRPIELPPASQPIAALADPGSGSLLNANLVQSDTLKQTCTDEQQVQARIAKMNGYTNGPKCD